MKIMAVDLGDARTGIAACDRTETLASPLGVLRERNGERLVEKVAAALDDCGAGMVVVGNPLNMDGTSGERSEKARAFAEALRQAVQVPVVLWDERRTTVTAHQILTMNESFGQRRKDTVDEVAAVLILESYLAYRKNHPD